MKHSYRSILIFLFVAVCAASVSAHELTFDPGREPFSYRGSSIAITETNRLADVSGHNPWRRNRIVEIGFLFDGVFTNASAVGRPEVLTYTLADTVHEVAFENERIVRFRGKGLPMALKALKDVEIVPDGSSCRIQKGEARYVVLAQKGRLLMENGFFVCQVDTNGEYEVSLHVTDASWTANEVKKRFNECVADARQDFDAWLSGIPAVPPEYEETRQLAAYVLWESMLSAGGENFTRDGILMGKFEAMHYIWSWDHCFNAMALSYGMPDVAWDQLMIMFDHQNEAGCLSDYIGKYGSITYKYKKPPIHGWALDTMLKHMTLTHAQKQEAYDGLKAWTDYWFAQDQDGNGVLEYNHGNDTGWDNGTELDLNGASHVSGRRESANLMAYLCLQMDMLERLAGELGRRDEAAAWRTKSDILLQKTIDTLWDPELKRFVTRIVDQDRTNGKYHSLMAFLPLAIGDRLPEDIRQAMLEGLKHDGYITEWGLATELPTSPYYNTTQKRSGDVYWRGPIWAPPVMIIVDGLYRMGETELANDISIRFMNVCRENGFAENFDALTGEALCDPAYTWTASVFLVLAHELVEPSY
jgi:glycogen debranching enzyme